MRSYRSDIMDGVRIGGEKWDGFEGDLGQVPWDEPPEEICKLCLRLKLCDTKWLCDGKKECPFIGEMLKGIMVDCVEY